MVFRKAVLFTWKAALFTWKAVLFTNGLPSVLYKTPGLNERSVLNQLFLMISGAFHMKSTMLFTKSTAFHEKRHFSRKAPLFMKSAAFHEKRNAFHMKSTAFHEKRRISLWAFGWWASIGLSFERPIIFPVA